MDQNSKSKVKLFRALKVIFYCLGLPLFFLATCAVASSFFGHIPFQGSGSGLFSRWAVFFSSPALYGVWVALGVWLVIAAVQIILSKTVGNRRARTLVTVAVTLVVMLVPVFVMDAVFTAKIDNIAKNAPAGVTVADYKTQLSFYRTKTSGGSGTGRMTSYTESYIEDVNHFLNAYNLPFDGDNKEGKANNRANTPVYYDEIGVDINKDGVVDAADHKLVKDAPTGEKLVIGNKTYEGYYFVSYAQKIPDGYNSAGVINPVRYLWYKTVELPKEGDGVYGTAVYNANGMLADGYVFGIDTALAVLEQYYYAKEQLEARLGNDLAAKHAEITEAAALAQKAYYESTEELKALWEAEMLQGEDFTLTAGELSMLLNILGTEVGKAKLIASLMPVIESFTPLSFNLVDLIGQIAGPGLAPVVSKIVDIEGVNLSLSYDEEKGLTITFTGGVFDDDKGNFTSTKKASFGIDEHLLANLQLVLEEIGVTNDLLSELLGLLGVSVALGDGASLDAAVIGLLQSLYWYSSPVIKPVYDFYVEGAAAEDKEIAELFAMYDRASYEGGMHGYVIGSQLIGDNIGEGTYPAALGLTSYAAVKQLQTDLSYKTTYYPLFAVRDMLLNMAVFVIFFLILSYIAAEREIAFATGKETVKAKKKKGAPADDPTPTDGEGLPEGEAAGVSSPESDKEVE